MRVTPAPSRNNIALSPVAVPKILDRKEPWETEDLENWLDTTTGSNILGESWDRVYRKRMITRQVYVILIRL